MYIKALNVPLEHVSSHFRFALDETLINPDVTLLLAYTVTCGVPLARDRASIWTFLPFLFGKGSITVSLLLQR